MSIEDEISAIKAAAEKKLRRLRERERKNQQAVDTRILTLLRTQHTDLADQFEVEARTQLDAETAQRSAKAKASRGSQSSRPSTDENGVARYDKHIAGNVQ